MAVAKKVPFPPTKAQLANLQEGEYLVYGSTEEEIGIYPPESLSKRAAERLSSARASTQQADFGAREMMMHDILQAPDLKPILEPAETGDYFDGRNVLEVQLKPCALNEMPARRTTLHTAVLKRAKHYGLTKYIGHHEMQGEKTPFITHVNISVWNRDGNLMDPAHPKFDTVSQIIIERIAREFVVHKSGEKKESQPFRSSRISLGPSRGNTIRFTGVDDNARLEIRAQLSRAKFEPFMREVERAIHSVMAHEPLLKDTEAAAVTVRLKQKKRGFFNVEPGQPAPKNHLLFHALNGAVILTDGHVRVARSYIRNNLNFLRFGFKDFNPDAFSTNFKYNLRILVPSDESRLNIMADRLDSIQVLPSGKLALPSFEEWKKKWINDFIEKNIRLGEPDPAVSDPRDFTTRLISNYLNRLDSAPIAIGEWTQGKEKAERVSSRESLHKKMLYDLQAMKEYDDTVIQSFVATAICTGTSKVPVGTAALPGRSR